MSAAHKIALRRVAVALAFMASPSLVSANAEQVIRNFDLFGVKLYQTADQAIAALQRSGLNYDVVKRFLPWSLQVKYSANNIRADQDDYTLPAEIEAFDRWGNELTIEFLMTREGPFVFNVNYLVEEGIAPAAVEARFREKVPGVTDLGCAISPGLQDSAGNSACLRNAGAARGRVAVSMRAPNGIKNTFNAHLAEDVQRARAGQINNRGGAANF